MENLQDSYVEDSKVQPVSQPHPDAKKGGRPLFLPVFLGLTGIGALLAIKFGAYESNLFQGEFLWEKLGFPIARLLFFISIGVFVGQLIEIGQWINLLSRLVRPLLKWGRLSDHLGAVFITAFFSGTSALSMLASFHEQKRVDDRGVLMSVLLNTFPSYFLHLPTTFFIILPLTGKAGLLYLAVTFTAAIFRLMAVLLWGRITLPVPTSTPIVRESPRPGFVQAFREAKAKFFKRIKRIIFIVVPVYIFVFMLSEAGFFQWLRAWIAKSVSSAFIPVEAISIVVVSLAAEFTSGFAAAGALLDSGAINLFETVLALLIGNIVASPVRAMRHQIPYYMGIFNPGMGMRLIILTQAFRTGSICLVGSLFLLFFRLVAL